MRRLVKTSAICLRVRNWRESSRIVTLLTPDLGLVTAVARGARRPKSRLAAALDLFARSEITIYLPKTSGLATLSDAELITRYPALTANYERFLIAARLNQFLLRALLPNHPEPRLYTLLETTLTAIAQAPPECNELSGLVGSFLLKAVSFLGFRPRFDRCTICHQSINSSSAWFIIRRGGLLCPTCLRKEDKPLSQNEGVELKTAELEILKTLLHTPMAKLTNLTLPVSLTQLINLYAEFHLNIKK
ncbi:MAG: DNA repair protein RecO [candidate division WOR-3 bacterium]|nr:DNA repair protein RecO [candidate division WOR-3 bacterium]MCR4424288.1 DNA repair protein RecO [candidate division WOR-3 bacterium]MDH7519732.1 DNA repair protein RecO [bacterium]